MNRFLALFGVALLSGSCTGSEPAASVSPSPTELGADVALLELAATPVDVDVELASVPEVEDVPPKPKSFCETLGLPERPWEDGTAGTLRHELAGEVSLTQRDGSTWSLKESWTGCESFVFLPDTLTKTRLDATPVWEADLGDLIAESPRNVHYVFVSMTIKDEAKTLERLGALQTRVEALVSSLADADRDHWKTRLHVAGVSASKLGGWLPKVLSTIGQLGFGIDRFQRLRGLGGLSDVTRYSQYLKDKDEWPWEDNLAYAAHEARYFNHLAKRAAQLAEVDATSPPTIVTLFSGETLEQFADAEVTLPSAQEMAGFDTLEVEVEMRCPKDTAPEVGNCGAWDYLAYLWLTEPGDAANPKRTQLARFITSYHRETHWVMDVSAMLAHVKDGGKRTLRWEWAPEWNKQPTKTWVSLRFSNRKRGLRPVAVAPLWTGGGLGSKYNAEHAPIDVPVPKSAKRVELYAVITGHGSETSQCAEFCRHQHEFTVGGTVFLKDHPTVGQQTGCIAEIERGMTPNQWGTWWLGRGGWCPGQQVEPYVVDVTALAPAGTTAKVSYRALVKGKEPTDGSGSIDLVSWLVFWE